jgi:voltage-gated potassium channel
VIAHQVKSIRAQIHDLMDGRDVRTTTERAFVVSISILIIVNAIAVILETEPRIYRGNEGFFRGLEVFSVAVFSIEYAIRLWTCTVESRFRHPLWGRVRYAFSFLGLVDLLSILPFYMPGWAVDLRLLRLFRLARFLRVLKLGRYSRAMQTLQRVIRAKKNELTLALVAASVLLIISASLMYFAEHDAQPNVFSSIPASMWWAVVTMTTVGYGDIYPITPIGKALAAIIALMSIGLFALPAGILASGFSNEMTQQQSAEPCPRCGFPGESLHP